MNLLHKWLKGIGVSHRIRARRRKARCPSGSRPRLEQLEERCLLTGNLPWPVTPPAGQSLSLYDTYGQFVGAGGLHFHEGIDIIAAADTTVTAVEKGWISFRQFGPVGAPQNSLVVEICGVDRAHPDHGWNYIHTIPGTNPRTHATWAEGDQVNPGDVLGRVSTFPAGAEFPTHLHLDRTSAVVDDLVPGVPILRPFANPLDYLQALNDTTAPTVSADKIHFRLAADEAAAAPRYFTDTLDGKIILGAQAQVSGSNGAVSPGSANIDIAADIYDQLQPGGNRLGAYSVGFSLTGMTWGDQTGNVTPFLFSGAFLGPAQDMTALRDAARVRTVYATDPYSQSVTDKDFWYTLTNSPVAAAGDHPPITAADSAVYWKSNVEGGNRWNATTVAAAADNAGAAFRDDFYSVNVFADDANGNKGQAQTTVLLVNYVRTVRTSAPEYSTTDPIIVTTGDQYTARQLVPLYILTAAPREGQALPRAALAGTDNTNIDGMLQTMNLTSATQRGLAAGSYWVVADYLGDGTYHGKLDAFTPITVVNKVAGTTTITDITPRGGNGDGGNQVTITGSGFNNATRVQFGSNAATNVRVVSDTQITCTSPAGTWGSTVAVTVTSPQGTSATNSAAQFTYRNLAPAITGIDPNQGSRLGGTRVTITGTGFTGAYRVQFGITPATNFTVESNTQIVVTAPAGAPGQVDVRVVSPWGTSPVVPADQFTYTRNAPTVTRVAPAEGSRFGGNTVTITGTGFLTATDVRFDREEVVGGGPRIVGGAATSFTVVNDTTITATVPPGTGTVDVRVINADGTSARAGAPQYTYLNTPAVTNVDPNGGLPAGGIDVTITGSNFVAAAGGRLNGSVRFGTVTAPAADVTFVDAEHLRVKVPALPAGTQPPATVHVTVTSPAGTSPVSVADQYTYAAAPAVTAVVPNQGLPAGGNTVRITGTNFTGAFEVKFGTDLVPRQAVFTVDSPTQITVTAPPHAVGVVDITVRTPSGTSPVVAADRYTYAPVPDVTAINPTHGPATGGTAVIITGTAFTNVTSVNFGALAATRFTVNSATQITATAPAQPAGPVDVTVTTPSGTSAVVAAGRYTYDLVATTTTITSFNPSVFGQTVTFTATVTPAVPGATPTGTVGFAVDGAVVANPVVDASGRARYVTSGLAVGDHTVIAFYSGDRTFDQSTSARYTQTVNKADTRTAIGSSANPSNFGQSVTFTATISAVGPGFGQPTGQVVWFVDGVGQGPTNLNGGQATFATADLAVGDHRISASYRGDASFNSSLSATLTQTVNQALSMTGVNSSAEPSVFGTAVTFTATVSAVAAGSGTPTGSVQFQVDGVNFSAPVLLTAGRATSSSLSTLTAGAHTITALYGGQGVFGPSTGTFTQNVSPARLTITPNPSQSKVYGAALPVLTYVPTGFVNGDSASLVTGGLGTLATAASPVGNYAFTLGTLSAGNNYALVLATNPPTFAVTPKALTITANNQSKVYGATLPALTVSYSGFVNGDTAASLTTAPTLTTTATVSSPVGSYPITVSGAVAGNYTISYVTGSLTVNQASTVTAVAANSPTSVFGEPIYFAAAVAAVLPGAGSPTGTVAFKRLSPDGTTVVTLGTGTLNASGTAIFVMDHFVPSTQTVFAVYLGDSNFTTSTSPTITHTVNPASTTLTLSSSNPASVAGQAVQLTTTLGVVAPGSFVVPATGTITIYDTFHGSTTVLSTVTVGSSATWPSLTAAGTHVITAVYSGDSYFNGSSAAAINQVVSPAAATHLQLVAAQGTIYPGVPFAMTITALDAYGNTATDYRGTIHFTCSDPQASVPGDVTFTAADNGVVTVSGFVLRSPADQTFTATDTLTQTITGTAFFRFMP
jgi:hypothetical protein